MQSISCLLGEPWRDVRLGWRVASPHGAARTGCGRARQHQPRSRTRRRLGRLRHRAASSAIATGLGSRPAGPPTGAPAASSLRLKDLRADQLSDLLATTIVEQSDDPAVRTRLIIAADEVAHDAATPARLAGCANAAEELEMLRKMLEDRKVQMLAAQGAGTLEQDRRPCFRNCLAGG